MVHKRDCFVFSALKLENEVKRDLKRHALPVGKFASCFVASTLLTIRTSVLTTTVEHYIELLPEILPDYIGRCSKVFSKT